MAAILLSVRALRRPGVVDSLSFDVRAGEIVGLAGLLERERRELSRLIFGCDPRAGGTVELAGRPVAVRSPREAIHEGIVLAPPGWASSGWSPPEPPSGRNRAAAVLDGGLSEPRLLIAETAADATARELIGAFAERGAAVLLLAAEPEDLRGLAHRILVLRAGRLVAELDTALVA